jgi:hypothetical protein
MKARILKSPYGGVTAGTVGDIITITDGGALIEVDGTFTMAGANPSEEPGKRQLHFDRGEFERLAETVGSMLAWQGMFLQGWNLMATAAHSNAVTKGFWLNSDKLQSLASAHELGDFCRKVIASNKRDLMHAELGEACEADRTDAPSTKIPGFTEQEEELADVVIRLGDFSAKYGLRVGEAVLAKMGMNAGRPQMHGGKAY